MDQGKQLEEKVFALVAEAAPAKAGGGVRAEMSLRRDLGLDSLGLATLFFHFGEALEADPDALVEMLADEPVNTVADMVALGVKIQRAAAEGPRP
jgi:acyl carrier protein